MADEKWMKRYEEIKDTLRAIDDIDRYFREKEIAGVPVDVLEIGEISFPTGEFIACDPFEELEKGKPYLQKIPAGTYPAKICVMIHEEEGERYAALKIDINGKKPAIYECAVVPEDRDAYVDFEPGQFLGFGVDSGIAGIADISAREALNQYVEKLKAENPKEKFDLFEDLFMDLMDENVEKYPKYQTIGDSWLNWTVPGTEENLILLNSGFGDGTYPCYMGIDEEGEICALYLWFINLEIEFEEDE